MDPRGDPRRIRFTDRGVAALNTEGGRLDVWSADIAGWGIRVRPSGRKTWIVRYRWGRRRRVLALGNYPSISVADARKNALRALRDVSIGGDPAALRDQQRSGSNVSALVEQFVASREFSAFRPQTRAQFSRALRSEAVRALGNDKPGDITKQDIRRLVDGIADRGTIVWARRVLTITKKLWRWAEARDLIATVPAWPPPPGEERPRERVLTEEEIRRVWVASSDELGILGAAFRLMLLTAQRRGEVLNMRWSDLAIETDGAWWSIPAEFTKAARAHRVPLSPEAVTIIEDLRPRSGDGQWVFQSDRRDGAIANPQKAADRLWARAGVAGATLHDLRRTAASGMAGLGVPTEIVGRILNHSRRGVTASVYAKYGFGREMRNALESWAERVDEVVSGLRAKAEAVPTGGRRPHSLSRAADLSS